MIVTNIHKFVQLPLLDHKFMIVIGSHKLVQLALLGHKFMTIIDSHKFVNLPLVTSMYDCLQQSQISKLWLLQIVTKLWLLITIIIL